MNNSDPSALVTIHLERMFHNGARRGASSRLPNVPHAKLRGQGRAATRTAARWLLPCVLASAQAQFAANVTPSELCSAQAARPPGRSRAATASAWS